MSPHVRPVMLSDRVGYYNSILLPSGDALADTKRSDPRLRDPVEAEEAYGPRVLTGCGARKAAR